MRIRFIAPLLILLAAAPASRLSAQPASPAAPKVLMLVSTVNLGGIIPAVMRAMDLKTKGVEVSVIFERGGVMAFAYLVEGNPSFKAKLEKKKDEFEIKLSSNVAVNQDFMLALVPGRHPKQYVDTMNRFRSSGVTYTVCGASLEVIFGLYDEFASAGLPVSPKSREPIDISDYIKQGYQVLVF